MRRIALLASRRRSRGFSAVELVVTLSIVSILTVIAVPAFNGVIAGQRVSGASADLYVALARTRSTASALNKNVTLSAKAGGWQNGWFITDPNNPNGAPIDTHEAVPGIQVLSAYAAVTYRPSGRLPVAANPAPSFVIQDNTRNGNAAHCVSIDLGGRPYTKNGTVC